MNIKSIGIEKIRPYANNPRKNEEAIRYVKESIREFGFKVPIVVSSKGIIVCGHSRYEAAKSLGMQELPCIIADDLTEEQIKAFRLVDNKTAEFAVWDLDRLADELEGIDIDMEAFGFDDAVLEEVTKHCEDCETAQNTGNVAESNHYKEQYGVIVICKDETDQEKTYNRLHELGYECKVVTT